jgi:hypothetical protein
MLTLATTLSASAQISYVQFQSNGTQTLRQINADGGGDTALATPFSVLAFPAWSRDRSLLALTATDPARPSQISLNVFTLNPATGASRNITNFEDTPAPNYSLKFCYHKAFSPDGSLLAVDYVYNFRNDNGTFDYSFLQIFRADGGGSVNAIPGVQKNGNHHDGEGVTWSPTQNVLAVPAKTDTPLQSGGGKGETTAIWTVTNPAGSNYVSKQLTFPHADQVVSPTDGYYYGEHDYQPKYSPNGTAVAYVRSLQVARYANNYVPDPDVQSLHIINVNTGADTQVIQFQRGLYVTTLDWSPDGSALVFDIGQEASSSGNPAQVVQANTDQVYVINVDGNALRQLRGSGSGEPSWEPNSSAPIVFGNVATRVRVGTGDSAMIGGFIISGNQPKKVLIRGMGPSLAKVGVQGVLTDPFLELHQGDPIIATNDNWQQAPNTNEIPNGFAPGDPRESVIVMTLQPGNYTAILKGAHGETGIGIVEAYDLTQSATTKFGNISTRGFVDPGDNAMFGGFIINGGNDKVMVRARGPSLQAFGVANTLQDPTLDLVDVNGVVLQSNDNWQQAPNTNEIPNGFTPSDPRESVIVTTLPPGNYSAIVRGKNNTSGVAIVEAYNLQ